MKNCEQWLFVCTTEYMPLSVCFRDLRVVVQLGFFITRQAPPVVEFSSIYVTHKNLFKMYVDLREFDGPEVALCGGLNQN